MNYFIFSIFFFSTTVIHSQAIKSNTFKKAEKAYYKEDYEKAETLYYKTIKDKGPCSQCYSQLANIYSNDTKFKKALELINKSIVIEESLDNENKTLGYYFSIRSFIHFNLGDLKKARKDISRAIKVETDNDNYYFMRSLMRRMDGDLSGCCKDLESAKELGHLKAQEYISIYCSK